MEKHANNKQTKKERKKETKHTQVNQSLIGKRSAIELPPRTGSVRFRPSNRNGLIKLDGFILTCEGKEEKKDEYQDVWYGMGDKKKNVTCWGDSCADYDNNGRKYLHVIFFPKMLKRFSNQK